MFTGKLNTELNTAKKFNHTLQKVPTQHIVFPFPNQNAYPRYRLLVSNKLTLQTLCFNSLI